MKENTSNYEINFLKFIINKCIQTYREKCGDKITSLFRKDNLNDDLIKYVLFIFGSSFVHKIYSINIIKLVERMKFGLKNHEEMKENYYFEEKFFCEFDEFLSDLSEKMPIMLRFILRLIHMTVLEHFQIEKNNYRPLFTYLFFYLIFSPKLQDIFYISPSKYTCVMNINKIIRNMCFNTLFIENDPLSRFNNLINKHHLKLTNTFDNVRI